MNQDQGELLDLAAKAAGIAGKYCEFTKHPEGTIRRGIGNPYVFAWGDYLWNPLNDDGDALPLAVKLRMRIDATDDPVFVNIPGGVCYCEDHNNDPCAATRRAIVRAAAAIGKQMKEQMK